MTYLMSLAAKDRALQGASLLLILGSMLSGGGSSHILAEILVETAALFVMVWLLAGSTRQGSPEALAPLFLLGCWAGLIALQLVPLPASLWRALPGRELAIAIADQVGAGARAHPFSLDPAATRRALAALLPAAAMLLSVAHMDLRGRCTLARLAILCALASLVLGLVQILSHGTFGTLYAEGHVGFPTGLFANRNHQASLLLVAIAMTSTLVGRESLGHAVPCLLAAGFAAGTVATTSRAGLLLLPIALLPLTARYIRAGRIWLLIALPLISASIYVLATNNALVRLVLGRLENGNLNRVLFWQDSWRAIARFWPIGSGYGTFPSVYQTVESLEHLGRNYVNHAHNEVLEIMLEGGLPAVLLLGAAIVWWFARGIVVLKSTGPRRTLGIAAWTGLLVLLLHSLVDYPIRILSIELVAAMLAGFLTAPAPSRDAAARRPSTLSRHRKQAMTR